MPLGVCVWHSRSDLAEGRGWVLSGTCLLVQTPWGSLLAGRRSPLGTPSPVCWKMASCQHQWHTVTFEHWTLNSTYSFFKALVCPGQGAAWATSC